MDNDEHLLKCEPRIYVVACHVHSLPIFHDVRTRVHVYVQCIFCSSREFMQVHMYTQIPFFDPNDKKNLGKGRR